MRDNGECSKAERTRNARPRRISKNTVCFKYLGEAELIRFETYLAKILTTAAEEEIWKLAASLLHQHRSRYV